MSVLPSGIEIFCVEEAEGVSAVAPLLFIDMVEEGRVQSGIRIEKSKAVEICMV